MTARFANMSSVKNFGKFKYTLSTGPVLFVDTVKGLLIKKQGEYPFKENPALPTGEELQDMKER